MNEQRESVINALIQAIRNAAWEGDVVRISTEGARIIVDVLKGQDWISVKDRLPEEYTHVLVCEECHVDYPDAGMFDVKRSLVKEGYWSRGFDGGEGRGWYHCIQPDMAKKISGVTHWMPLPEMPEEVNDAAD